MITKTLIIFILLFSICFSCRAEEKILNIDEIDYFIYKNHRLTFDGLINTLMEERRVKFINELKKEWRELWVR